MKRQDWMAAVAVIASLTLPAGTATAQDAPPAPQEEEILSAPAPAAAEGPSWSVFSQSASSNFLINGGEIESLDDEVRVRVARVPKTGDAADYSHVVDVFAVRCDASQSHLVSSAEAYEDGEVTEAFDADEPWADIQEGSFDAALREIGCGRARATGEPYPNIKAYIDAGRP